jgi:hypothetical protein
MLDMEFPSARDQVVDPASPQAYFDSIEPNQASIFMPK